MRLISSVLAVLMILPTSFCLARPLYKLPAGARLQTPEGTFQGYTLEEMKILLKMDVDLEYFEAELPKYKQALGDYKKLIEAREIILTSKDVQIDLLKKDQERLTKKWTEENKLRHECENKPKFGSWIAWGTAGVLAAVAISLGIVLAVKTKD